MAFGSSRILALRVGFGMKRAKALTARPAPPSKPKNKAEIAAGSGHHTWLKKPNHPGVWAIWSKAGEFATNIRDPNSFIMLIPFRCIYLCEFPNTDQFYAL